MIVKHLDLRKDGELKKYISLDEVILDVYFLIEVKPSTAYHLITIVIKTTKCLYIAPRGSYAFESSGGGKEAMIKALINIFEINPQFNSFHFWCADNKDLDELEDETLIQYNEAHLPKTKTPQKNDISTNPYMREAFNQFKDIALKRIKQ